MYPNGLFLVGLIAELAPMARMKQSEFVTLVQCDFFLVISKGFMFNSNLICIMLDIIKL